MRLGQDLPRFHPDNRLPLPVLPIQAKGLEHRYVVHGEKNGFLLPEQVLTGAIPPMNYRKCRGRMASATLRPFGVR